MNSYLHSKSSQVCRYYLYYITTRREEKESYALTVGDTIVSFLGDFESLIRGMCLVDKKIFQIAGICWPSDPVAFKARPIKWREAALLRRWMATMIPSVPIIY